MMRAYFSMSNPSRGNNIQEVITFKILLRLYFTTLMGNISWIAFRHIYIGKVRGNLSMLLPVTASDLIKN